MFTYNITLPFTLTCNIGLMIFMVVNSTLFWLPEPVFCFVERGFFSLFEEENYEQNMLPTLNMRISKTFDIKKERQDKAKFFPAYYQYF